MIIANLQIVRRILLASILVASLTAPAFAVDLTWTGASSSLIFDNGNATGNWTPSVPTGVQGADENWIFPDAATLGAGSTTPVFDSGGILTVGGPSFGGVTFLTGAPAYTFTQTDVANTLNLAGSTNDNTTTDRGVITNNSANTQTFNMDVISTRGTIDAASGDIVFSAGHTFTTGGPEGLSPGSTSNANTYSTIFQGDHNIYLNSNVVQTTTDTAGTNGQRGLLRYRGASTPDSPASAGALILGDLGTFGGRIVVDSTNGGVVRATNNNSFGIYGGTTQSGTFIGNGNASTGDTSNATVELDGSAGNITTQESFYVGMRDPTNNTVAQMRNVAGNNTITGFFSLNSPTKGANLNVFNSAYIESLAGKLTFQGSISNDRTLAGNPSTTYLYLKGNGDFDLGGGPDGGIYGINTDTFVLNVDKSGTGTATLVAGLNPVNNWSGTTTIHAGSWIVNANHTTAGAAPYIVEAPGTLGGNGTIGSTVNLSGKIAPGAVGAVGTFTLGGLTLTSGILDFQLDATTHTAGSGINDLIVDTGALDLSGGATLNVTGIGGNLSVGDYDLIQFASGFTGAAMDISLGTIPLASGFSASIVIDSDSVNLHIASGGLPGDYNGDGKVNAADYVVWRKDPAGHGGTPGGYNTWRANFGNPPGSGSGSLSTAGVPEPTTFALVGLLGSLLIVKRRSRVELVFVLHVAAHPAL